MNYCGYCGTRGHNRRTCSTRKKNLAMAAEQGNAYAKAELERKASPRTCGFCDLVGHDRRTCQHLKDCVDELGTANLQVRKELCRRAQRHNFGVGSLVSVKTSDFVDGAYVNSEQFGIIQAIEWDRVGYFDEWDQATMNRDPVTVHFFSKIAGATHGTSERRFPFPFEIGYLGEAERESFSHWRFDGDLKIVSAMRGDKEGESSLLDLAGCRMQAKKLIADREWGHSYTSRRIDGAKKMVENFTSCEE